MTKKKEKHPTLFVFEGSIKNYEDGTMLRLHSLVQPNEWELMVEETVKYKIFLECLKTVAYPILDEHWTKEDEWFKLQLEVAVSRMRNIDPVLLLKWNQEKLKNDYTIATQTNANSVSKAIKEMKQQQREALTTRVSDL